VEHTGAKVGHSDSADSSHSDKSSDFVPLISVRRFRDPLNF
jgi:hypothetical protein